ncbi:hypothetical protein ABZU45_41585, partial [Streptomyces avermitilis]
PPATGASGADEVDAVFLAGGDQGAGRDVAAVARREGARHAVVGDFAANITPCAFWPRGAEPATHIDYTVGALVVQNQWAPDPTAQRPCQAPCSARFTHPGRERGAWPLTCWAW